ncbi:PREDICTED: small glutamine-rich tetratricopeptide repeat-containing protein [Camelina sativa]|uniref:Small glutamine-rich tetratricopeptide repeat-containing protein n=1 Tax=Camelina sativa TaxID=90675 RepID=A0ABM0T6T7_CAMSA|nr:PREDICTED: small glutamine-rich tetratricopeptide repeat-containing protein [Camelina sativa]
MAKLTTDSPICHKIVLSFLDFLDSVEVSPGVDEEGLEVARECLGEAFKVNSDSSRDDRLKPVSLVNLFTSLDQSEPLENIPPPPSSSWPPPPSSSWPPPPPPVAATQDPSSSSGSDFLGSHVSVDTSKEPIFTGTSRDELFGQLFGALEKVRYFRNTPEGDDDPAQLEKATRIFHDAVNEMEKSGCQTFDVKSLAETLKCQGNKAMQSNLYLEAIELYSFAIALTDKNAVFYCNRAAAYTQINRCSEAIKDCLKSIEIDPNYSKAYSRLGLAYYAQGKYADAIEKGFKKALQLDPHNESVKENIRVAEQKLREEQQRQRRGQNTSTGHNQEPGMGGGQGIPSQFSMPLNPDLMSMFMNTAGNTFPGNHFHNEAGAGADGNRNGSDEPEIRVGGNINIDLGGTEQMPEDLSGALRSMMQMFGGGSQGGTGSNNPQDNNGVHGRPSGNQP